MVGFSQLGNVIWLSLMAWSGTVSSEPGVLLDALSGSYDFSRSTSELEAVEDQIEQAVAGMNFLVRPIARRRLKFLTKPAALFSFTPIADGVRVANEWVVRECFLNGTQSDFTDRRGQARQSVCAQEGQGIRETFLGLESGSWTHTFHLSEDHQTLTQSVVVTSPSLGAPVQFSLTYLKR